MFCKFYQFWLSVFRLANTEGHWSDVLSCQEEGDNLTDAMFNCSIPVLPQTLPLAEAVAPV